MFAGRHSFQVLGFQVLGFQVLGFQVLGFQVLGLQVRLPSPASKSGFRSARNAYRRTGRSTVRPCVAGAVSAFGTEQTHACELD
jgi:hypothetical protein